MKIRKNRFLSAVLLMAGALSAQDGPRGHWTGTIDIPDHALAVEVDLDKTANGWVGSISIPEQNASGLPLEAIAVTNGKCTFRIKGAPGEPTFNGTLSADGKSLPGDFTQGSASFPFKLSRTGDARVEEVRKSPAVAKEFLGTWEGTLEAGQSLRLVLKIANGENGANAILVSVDQGGVEIPVTTIEQKETKLTLLVKAVGGGYQGEINKDGTELNGTWTQAGNDLPLKLRKKGSEAPKP
jgi:hypothetical protein